MADRDLSRYVIMASYILMVNEHLTYYNVRYMYIHPDMFIPTACADIIGFIHVQHVFLKVPSKVCPLHD